MLIFEVGKSYWLTIKNEYSVKDVKEESETFIEYPIKSAMVCRYSRVGPSWCGPVSSLIMVSHETGTGVVVRDVAKRLGWNGEGA